MSQISLYNMLLATVDLVGGVERDLSRSGSYLNASRVATQMQAAYRQMTNMGRKKTRSELLQYANVTADTTTNLVNYRWSARRGQLVGMFTRPASGEGSTTPTQVEWRAFNRRPQSGFERVGSIRYRIANTRIYIVGEAQTNQATYRIWWLRKPGTLHQGTVSAATANSITFPTTPTYGDIESIDDAYVGDYVRIVSGTGAFQDARITDYVASTRVATLESLDGSSNAFSTIPDGTSVYSIMPWFPEEYHDTLVHLTATRLKKVDLSAEIISEAAAQMEAFRAWVELEDQVSPFDIINLGNVDTGLMGDAHGFGSTVSPDGYV